VTELAVPPVTPAPRVRERHARTGYTMVIASAVLFAVNGAVSKIALQQSGIGTERWTQLRSTGAFVGLALVLSLFAPARLRVGRRELLSIAVYGVIGFALVQWLYFVAIERLPIGIGLLFEFTAPVIVALWARFVWHEPVRRRVWVALALVLAGLGLVAQVWDGLTLDRIGVAAGLAAAGALAVFWLQGERMVARRDPLSLVCLAMGASAVFWAVILPWWSFPFDALTTTAELPGGLGLSLPVGVLAVWTIVLGSIVPFALQVGALRHLSATTVGIVATFEPVAASVVAWVWLDEVLDPVQVLGGGVVLAGILLAETSRRGHA
jgi:drug/metabolite transporter (DMT)-like permease